jgi:hypothetical protein
MAPKTEADVPPAVSELDGNLIQDEATLFASPLPLTGARKTTTKKELWVHFLSAPQPFSLFPAVTAEQQGIDTSRTPLSLCSQLAVRY